MCGVLIGVSTHSRPEAAGYVQELVAYNKLFQLTAARRRLESASSRSLRAAMVSTHSRPEAAGGHLFLSFYGSLQFQLTAARRRLGGLAIVYYP